MSKEQPNFNADELEKDFSDIDLALDVDVELFGESVTKTPLDRKPTAEERVDRQPETDAQDKEEFQKEFKAIFEDEPKAESPQKKQPFLVAGEDSFIAGFYDWIRCVLLAVSVVVFCLTFVFRLVEVDGKSMMDTLENADKVVVTDMFYKPHNNDIIVIAHATNYSHPIIKRVIAIGGQTVKLDYDNEKIFVDGAELTEDYIKGTTFSNNGNKDSKYLEPDESGNFVIPEGKLFVLGDNRAVSLDSRSPEIGLIDVKDVIGKAQFVVFPFNRFGNVYDK